MHDLVLKGGTVIDGTGQPARRADVAIDDGRITEITPGSAGRATREIDAEDRIVTPGFVDIHTHYDGQMTWDPVLAPSSLHGVTTLVTGNCGVGFAPVRPNRHEWLVSLMEGVEDIPGTALTDGMAWNWESFPEFLDRVDELHRAVDVGTQIAHGPLRAYVMGERGERNEPALPSDVEQMAQLVREAMAAGALGFTTSRTTIHRSTDGEVVPGTYATEDELLGIVGVLGEMNAGVFELVLSGVAGEDLDAPLREMEWIRSVALATGRPVTFGVLQHGADPDQWRKLYDLSSAAAAEGARLHPQVLGRCHTVLIGLESVHPFMYRPTYMALADLPLDQRVERLRNPEIKRSILAESDVAAADGDGTADIFTYPPDRLFPLGASPDYEPTADQSIGALAARVGMEPLEVLYDVMLRQDGRELVMYAIMNYHDGDFEVVRAMLEHPLSIVGIADGGAHVRFISDASLPTFMVSHWALGRTRGERLPLESVIKKQTNDTASLYGLEDRGVLAPGYKADVNVIDPDSLGLGSPFMVHDLPTGAPRLMQTATGYDFTIVGGVPIREGGEDTGERPGRLIRGQQPKPS